MTREEMDALTETTLKALERRAAWEPRPDLWHCQIARAWRKTALGLELVYDRELEAAGWSLGMDFGTQLRHGSYAWVRSEDGRSLVMKVRRPYLVAST